MTDEKPQPEPDGPSEETAAKFMLSVQDAPITPATLDFISRTAFVPDNLRGKPRDMLAAVLTGRELGLGPMTSMRAIDVIDGGPTPSAELLNALVRAAGHEIVQIELSRERCVVKGIRHDNPADPQEQTGEYVHEFTYEDAEQVVYGKSDRRLVDKQVWRSYRKSMLWARGVSGLCRMYFPDVTLRVAYTFEEVAPAFDPARLCDNCGLHPAVDGKLVCGLCYQSGAATADEKMSMTGHDDDVEEAVLVDETGDRAPFTGPDSATSTGPAPGPEPSPTLLPPDEPPGTVTSTATPSEEDLWSELLAMIETGPPGTRLKAVASTERLFDLMALVGLWPPDLLTSSLQRWPILREKDGVTLDVKKSVGGYLAPEVQVFAKWAFHGAAGSIDKSKEEDTSGDDGQEGEGTAGQQRLDT